MFSVRRSRRYHLHRERFFGRLNFLTGFFTALTGSATFAFVLADWERTSVVLALATAVFGAIELAGQTTMRARLHNNLVASFTSLERDMVLAGDEISAKQLREFTARRLDMEIKEPPPYKVLDVMCHNEEVIARGYPKRHLKEIAWWQRLAASVIDLNAHPLVIRAKPKGQKA